MAILIVSFRPFHWEVCSEGKARLGALDLGVCRARPTPRGLRCRLLRHRKWLSIEKEAHRRRTQSTLLIQALTVTM
jgi:hypothetical protein